jgi:hypothetical protein
MCLLGHSGVLLLTVGVLLLTVCLLHLLQLTVSAHA